MKRLKGMKKNNKWMILLVGVFFCALGGFTQQITSTNAAQTDDQNLMTIDYLDPFDLTVTPLTLATDRALVRDTSLLAAPASTTLSSTTFLLTSAYSQPLKIWIPYRPTFRSPCVPSL